MNKLFTKVVGLCLGLTMAVGVGVAIGTNQEAMPVKATEGYDSVYTLDTTASGVTTTNNSYGSAGTATVNSVGWSFTGNGQMQPWRAGGKSITNTNRPLYTTSPISNDVNRIEVTFGTASSITVNSFTVSVHETAADASGGSSALETLTPDFKASSTVGIDLSTTRTGCYYRFVLNVTVSDTKNNRFVQVSKVEFLRESKSLSSISVGGIMSKTNYNTAESWDPAGLTVTATYDDESTLDVTNDAEWSFSPHTPADAPLGETSVTATATYQNKTNSKSQTVTVTEYVADSYEKVTSAPTDWSGEYLLVYEPEDSKPRVWTGVDAKNCYVQADIVYNQIAKPSEASRLEFAPIDGGYSIKVLDGDNAGKFISNATDANGLSAGPNAAVMTPSFDSVSSSTLIANAGGAIMRYNNSSSEERFRYYKSSSYTAQKPVQLYKKVEYANSKFVSDWNTATNAACSNPEADNTLAITAAWPGIKTNYLKLSVAGQAIIAAGDDPKLASLIERYDHIVERYGLENFMERSVASSSRINVFNTMNDNGSIAIIVVVSLVSVTAIGGYFFIRRRKEN